MNALSGVSLNNYTPTQAWELREIRAVNDADFQRNYQIPELLLDPAEVYEQLAHIERQLASNNDYQIGSAAKDDDILIIAGKSGILLTAEHATLHYPLQKDGTRRTKTPEGGTGALSIMVAENTQSHALVANGRQTGNANSDETHPFKDKMTEVISLPISRAHISIHGMMRAHASRIGAKHGFSVMIGVGDEPSEATIEFQKSLLTIGKDLGLRVSVNKPHLSFDTKAKLPRMLGDGTVKTEVFKAPNKTTRGWAQKVAKDLGKNGVFATVQLELSDVLRVHPINEEDFSFPSKRDREIGAYLGYQFVLAAVNGAMPAAV
jgi:hypothetical protein